MCWKCLEYSELKGLPSLVSRSFQVEFRSPFMVIEAWTRVFRFPNQRSELLDFVRISLRSCPSLACQDGSIILLLFLALLTVLQKPWRSQRYAHLPTGPLQQSLLHTKRPSSSLLRALPQVKKSLVRRNGIKE